MQTCCNPARLYAVAPNGQKARIELLPSQSLIANMRPIWA
jgi:hypothetical protein